MTARRIFAPLAAAGLLGLAACNGNAAVPPLSPQAQQVRVENSEPPAGATSLGAIRATHGQGCSFTGDRGSLAGATALLKEAAVQRGANFVQITHLTEPYSGHDCTHREFKIEGLAYRLAGTPLRAPSSLAVAPASAAPASPSAAPASVAPAVCNPICSPGYACEAGVCRPLCNPACAEGQSCRVDRVCVPTSAAP